MEIKYICKECKKVAKPKKDNSNDNWEVYDTECEYCGGELDMILE